MTVDIPGVGKYRVKWHHPIDKFGLRSTICNIHWFDSGDFVANGYAQCSERDHFERNKGRKISLTRALKHMRWPEDRVAADFRRYFWHEYRIELGHW